MADDGRTYIRVHDGMPDHPKVDALGDRAFRVLVESWCWCSRHLTDGRMPRATWSRRGTPAARRELVAAGLVEDLGGEGVRMHDYLDHQRSRAEVDEINAARRAASRKANHTRWHTGSKGKPDPECPHCNGAETDSESDARADRQSDNGRTSGAFPIGKGRGRGKGRSSVVESGGEVPEADARSSGAAPSPIFDLENPRCARHAHIRPGEPVPSCRDCAEVRRLTQQEVVDAQLAEQAARDAERASKDDCPDCDDNGMRDFGDLGVGRCTHPNLVRSVS